MILKELAARQRQFPPAFYDAIREKIDKFGEWPDRPLSQLTTLIAAVAPAAGYGWASTDTASDRTDAGGAPYWARLRGGWRARRRRRSGPTARREP